ncbi:hypothetical protein N7537_006943 [Penicillium hordei]|uniref:Zn(2)-C6 fungal-type domain-containing protein n=1 Tax=Penicillium hordei TaxID=40994 RepID=A0AAD6H4N3_9EURO|nr:uncharacterized protein N7537_006943 [Penicillium hordei]KAJ5603987.1 hypothetical protein N7537_006943 [Penicillium hordei]
MSEQTTTSSANDLTATSKTTKFKASCDFCALTKVKCDKMRPQCLRCTKSGVMCHYSETRRIGKARQLYAASYNSSKSPAMQGTLRPEPSNPRQQPQQAPMNFTAGASRRMSNSRPSLHGQCGPSDYMMSMNLFDDFLSQVPETTHPTLNHAGYRRTTPYSIEGEGVMYPFPSPESPEGLLPNLEGTGEIEMEDMDYIQEMELEGRQTRDTTAPRVLMPTARGHGGDCIKRASTVLQVLHVMRASCTWSGGPLVIPVRTLDAALGNNRIAMDTVCEILDCPCAHSMSVTLLLVMITHHVMESYRDILVQQACPPSPREHSAPGTDLLTSDIPLAIGGYRLDNEMRTRLILQVIRSELEKMASLFNTFARYAEGMSKQPEEAVLNAYINGLQATRHDILQSLEK